MPAKTKQSNGVGMRTYPESRSEQVAIAAIKRDLVLSLATRVCLAVFGVGAGVAAIAYALLQAGDLAASGGSALDGERLTAFLLPPALLMILSIVAGIAAWTIHSRNLDETYRALDAASRMRREAEVAVSARGLVHSFEEKLNSTHRAFTLLLWFGRTLFLVSLGLFLAAALNAIFRGADIYTAILGGTSLVGVVIGMLRDVPGEVKSDLADVVRIQTIVTGFHRQLSLLETYALEGDSGAHPERVLEAQERIDKAAERAAQRIARVEGRLQEETDFFELDDDRFAGNGSGRSRDDRAASVDHEREHAADERV